jgi:mannose-6-phosphate isomerase-like protein (cupin superfamily)
LPATHDQARASQARVAGYKGDAWTVDIPPDGDEPIVLLDTGVDSVAIVRIPNDAWERGSWPTTVHAHDGYDEAVLIPTGSGTVIHGPEAVGMVATRFEAPVTVVFPAGTWHQIALDPGVIAAGTCFYTVPGTVIERFSVQMDIVARDRVTFASLPVAHPVAVEAAPWKKAAVASETVVATIVASPPETDPAEPALGAASARIIPYPAPVDGLTLPLDTGHDSLFIMAGPPPAEPFVVPTAAPAVLAPPEFVDVHRHPDVDEYILRRAGAGYILNGATPETITMTPFRGPCVLVMPAGAFHRIVQTEEDQDGRGCLIYADRRAVVERFETIMARTTVATVGDIAVEKAPG